MTAVVRDYCVGYRAKTGQTTCGADINGRRRRREERCLGRVISSRDEAKQLKTYFDKWNDCFCLVDDKDNGNDTRRLQKSSAELVARLVSSFVQRR